MAPKNEPFVSIILVNFNGIKYTEECIRSLRKMDYKNYEVIVVDNGSIDNSLEKLRKMKDLKLIEEKTNVGFAKANNIGVANASKKADFIAILNNDTFVEKNWLKEVIAPFNADPTLGAVMPLIFNKYHKNEYVYEGYGTMTTLGFFSFAGLKGEPITENDLPEEFFASGCALVYPKKLSNKPFDDDYFIYAEDTYFCWLLRLQGFHIKSVPKAKIYHEGGAVTKDFRKMGEFFTYLGERNRILNMLIFYKWFSLLRLFPPFLFTVLLNNVYDPKNILVRLKSYAWILFHPIKILQKRHHIQKQRKVSDKEIFKYMSFKLFEEENLSSKFFQIFLKTCNKLVYYYYKLVGIKTKEMYDFKW